MSRGRASALLAAMVLVCWAALAEAETPEQRRRRELMEEIGLKRQPPSDKAAESPRAPAPAPAATPVQDETSLPKTGVQTTVPSAPSFRRTVHPALLQACQSCHVTGGPAGMTRLVLSGDPASDHRSVSIVVDPRDPPASPLISKAAGEAHGGGALWPRGATTATRVMAWITAGARLDAGVRVPAPVPPPTSPQVVRPVPAAGAAPVQAPQPARVPVPARSAPAEPAPPTDDARSPEVVHALLMDKCGSCHRPGTPAAATRLVLSGVVDVDMTAAMALVDREVAARSPLLTKAAGEMHGGGLVLRTDSDGYKRLLGWAASFGAGPVVGDSTTTTTASETAAPPPRSATGRPPPSAPPLPPSASSSPAGRPGIGLPYGFQLNGRFDLNYERRGFSTDPTASGAAHALRSYHHFLFLTRQSPQDKIGLSVELLGLLFWEANLRLHSSDTWQVVVAAGKLVVPFGADPLTHQSYGGLAGFDQRLLPTLWASEGAAAHLVVRWGPLTITDDLYVVRGHSLRRADAVLSLRSDLSPDDDARLTVGTRAGVAWGPLAFWYSAAFNPLGFGRQLFMQAADVTLWRAREWPVLRYLSIGAGLMRADVSGAGPGGDYYHFGSYFQVRLHPREWIYLQYRQGITTFDNRRGAFVDRSRLTSEDASAHNFGVVVRRGGLSAGLYWFVNLEAVEVPNDLARAVVTYEF